MSFAAAIGCISASKVLHHTLLVNILRAPMSFFDTTPLGRIVNRFARDVDVVDVNIPMALRIWLGTFSGVLSTIFVISYSTPIFLAAVVPLGIFYYFVQVKSILVTPAAKHYVRVILLPAFLHCITASTTAYRFHPEISNIHTL